MPVKDPKQQPVQPKKPEEAQANPLLEYQNRLKNALNKRYQDYVALLEKETNIARRYEIKERLEELTSVYKMLFE